MPSWTFFCDNPQRHLLVFVVAHPPPLLHHRPAPPGPTHCLTQAPHHPPPPPPPNKKMKIIERKKNRKSTGSWYFCEAVYNVFTFFLREKTQNSLPSSSSSPLPPPASPIHFTPPAPPLSRPSGVCVKCTLPWFFFIQYSVTCLCKFGLEQKKINLFMRESVLGCVRFVFETFLFCFAFRWRLQGTWTSL